MTQENEELLLKDLCARLPYDVKIHAKCFDPDTNTEIEKVGVLSMIDTDTIVAFTTDDTNCYIYVTIHEIKPYLFPLSSMTNEQEKEFNQLLELELKAISDEINQAQVTAFEIDFYNKHHFDWRGLIPIGLALDATGLNIY